MLREAIEKIEDMAAPKLFEADGHTYLTGDKGEYTEVFPAVPLPGEMTLHGLDALVKMIKTEALPLYGGPVFVAVETATSASVFLRPLKDERYERPALYSALADTPGWKDEVKLPFDQAAVALQTRFQEGGDRDYTLQLLSSITTGAKVTYNDIGVATNVIVAKGVALQAQEKIRPIVKLRPYRTFQEVDQPEGLFLIRIDERGITFTEADGGMWKLHARQTVAAWLMERLQAEYDKGDVVIML